MPFILKAGKALETTQTLIRLQFKKVNRALLSRQTRGERSANMRTLPPHALMLTFHPPPRPGSNYVPVTACERRIEACKTAAAGHPLG